MHPRQALESLSRATLRRLDAAPERMLRAAFGEPPRSDRGIELDLPTYALLRMATWTGRGRLHELDPVRARKLARRDGALLDLPEAAPHLVERHDFEIGFTPVETARTRPSASVRARFAFHGLIGGDGGPLRARLYRPRISGPRPIIMWLHGGGFVIGGLETHRGMCSNLAARSGCIVIAVDYRKAPEHRFPAAVEDALASFRWIRRHADALGGRSEQLVIGGDSAGGNLSAVVCQRLREAGEPQPALQVLIYPSTDARHPFPSYELFGEGLLLTADMLSWFWGHYTGASEDRDHPWLSPLRAPSFEGLAPALIRTAGFDPLRDEGSAYADALRAAGVTVDYRCYERLIHNYIVMSSVSSANRAAVEDLGDELRRFFAG